MTPLQKQEPGAGGNERGTMTQALARQEGAALTPTSPMGLLQLAIEREGSIDVIERLAKLQMEMMDREARIAYINAFEQFKANAPTIVKDAAIVIKGETMGKFAKLDQVCDKLIPALLNVGISHRWKTAMVEGKVVVTCYLRHRLGYEEEGCTLGAAPEQSGFKNPVQAVGSTSSYFERYTLLKSCGIAVKDQDNVDNPGGLNDEQFLELKTNIENAATVGDVTKFYLIALKAAVSAKDKQAFEDAAKKRKGELAK